MAETLTTARLTLRPWRADDVDFVFDLYSRWEVQQYLGTSPAVLESREQAVQIVERWMALEHPVHSIWAMEVTETGATVGAVFIKSIPASGESTPLEPSGDTEIGWHVHPDAWGNGYAPEAAIAALDYGFARGLEKIVAVTYPENSASQRVAEKAGMRHVGSTSEYYNVVAELFVATPR